MVVPVLPVLPVLDRLPVERPPLVVPSVPQADREWLDSQLDVIVSAVSRQRPLADRDLVSRTVGTMASELAVRYPLDGYFPVLVHAGALSLLPG